MNLAPLVISLANEHIKLFGVCVFWFEYKFRCEKFPQEVFKGCDLTDAISDSVGGG